MSNYEFDFALDRKIIKIALSDKFIKFIHENGWLITKKLGQGVSSVVFEVKNIQMKKYAALIIPVDDGCEFSFENLLTEYKKLQETNVFNTNIMIKIYDVIDCSNISITDDKHFCDNGPSVVHIVEKIDETLNESLQNNINNMSIVDKITFVINIKIWSQFVFDELFQKGYYYTDWSLNNIGIINERMVLIDLISIEKINKLSLREPIGQYKEFFSNIFMKEFLFEKETIQEYKDIIEFYNIIINCINYQKIFNNEELIVFETTKILNYQYNKSTKMFISADFESLHIPSDSKILEIGRDKCIEILYDLFRKGVNFSTDLKSSKMRHFSHMDDYGMIYLSPNAYSEKNDFELKFNKN